MKTYKQTERGAYRIDGKTIPNDPLNAGYQEMKKEVLTAKAIIINYVKPEADLEAEVRAKRDARLAKEIDIYTGIRWAACTSHQKGKLNDLRSMLLNITDQEGFPTDVVWPKAVNF